MKLKWEQTKHIIAASLYIFINMCICIFLLPISLYLSLICVLAE